MRLISVTIENFRCYRTPTTIRFDDMTALVGKNDAGKSTIMDALSIFFEASAADGDDASKGGDPAQMRITCEFDELPPSLIIDTDFSTELGKEHLLSRNQTLVIEKTYNGGVGKPTAKKIHALALHPTEHGCSDLLGLKIAPLVQRANELGVDLQDVDKRKKAAVRAAIWAHCPDLKLSDVRVPLTADSGKEVWDALQPYLPVFALFKSDRASTDQDAEAQDPLKAAIKEAVKEKEAEFQVLIEHVENEVRKIAAATVAKLREMDPTVANSLDPVVTPKRLDSLFSTSITGDEGIPLNKRGSGVKRLVLLNFFRAKAEKEARARNANSVIYAIEEPETSQHPRNQKMLLGAFRELSSGGKNQVILTTHTPVLARCLPDHDLRFIRVSEDGQREIVEGGADAAAEIAASLGVLPDHNVKLFVCVEGVNDINFLTAISRMLCAAGEDVANIEELEQSGQIIFVPLGGSNLAIWTDRLANLNRPEFHIYDRDNEPPTEPK